jgi:molybdopterin/thiamine biosynthesis adenylyltransferase
MPAELRVTSAVHHQLIDHLLAADGFEHAAVISCGYVHVRGTTILLGRRVVALGAADVATSSRGDHLEISPVALAREAKEAANRGETVVIAHSHPFPGPVAASPTDLLTERDLCGRVLPARTRRPVGALVVGLEGFDGRVWSDSKASALTVRIGGRLATDAPMTPPDDRTARQLLVWGWAGQSRLAAAHVVVVGVGGTGSHVALQLAHLGMGKVTLIDDDLVETSNLSRLVGATAADVGSTKVDTIGRHMRRVRPEMNVTMVRRSVLDVEPADVAVADLIVCCTDGHSSRAWLTELSSQYLVTLIDMGVEVQATSGATRAGGGVRVCRPGEPCLHCAGVIEPALVRAELLSPGEKAVEVARGYLRSLDTPAPSVVSLNGVVASLAVLEAVNELVGLFSQAPNRLLYRAEARSVTTAATASDERCYVCGTDGIVGLGGDRPLFGLVRDSASRVG